jgi:hypothetical protein
LATRQLIEDRVTYVPPIRFFTQEEVLTMAAVCNRMVPQGDRLPEWRIPILNYIDERLYEKINVGYRFEGMPPDEEAYRLGVAAIEQTALAIHAERFHLLDSLKQDFLMKSIHDCKKLVAPDIWANLDIHRFWDLLLGDCIKAYYAHPWAWNEIGYGGPAYPRAYMRLEGGKPEPWEVDEQRYEWLAPFDSISDTAKPTEVAGPSSHPHKGVSR